MNVNIPSRFLVIKIRYKKNLADAVFSHICLHTSQRFHIFLAFWYANSSFMEQQRAWEMQYIYLTLHMLINILSGLFFDDYFVQ